MPERIKNLSKEQIIALSGMEHFYYGTLKQGDAVVIPPGCIVAERSPDRSVSYGVKVPFLHMGHAEMWNRAWSHMQDSKKHPHYAQMVAIADVYAGRA